jgi:Zn finger protein HypA/HybF involved in hydrogenase expression
MHESGLAAGVANALRRARLDGGNRPVTLVVSGGHDQPDAFDAAFRMHLSVRLPGFDLKRLAIEHRPSRAVCVTCLGEFFADDHSSSCPICGGAGLVAPVPETAEIEWGDEPCA